MLLKTGRTTSNPPISLQAGSNNLYLQHVGPGQIRGIPLSS